MSWQGGSPVSLSFFFFSVQANALTLRMRMRMRMQQWELKDAIQYRFEKWRGWTKAHL